MSQRSPAQRRLHDLVHCLTDRQECGLPVRWGVLIHTCAETRELAATTSGGTTLPLTLRLLRALSETTVWLGGRTPAVIDETPSTRDSSPMDVVLLDLPVPAIEVGVVSPTGWQTTGGSLTLRTQLDALDLMSAPVVLLTNARPAGWPR